MTVDNCGVSRLIIDEVASRLERRVGLKRENFAVASSHTHSGPVQVIDVPQMFNTRSLNQSVLDKAADDLLIETERAVNYSLSKL